MCGVGLDARRELRARGPDAVPVQTWPSRQRAVPQEITPGGRVISQAHMTTCTLVTMFLLFR